MKKFMVAAAAATTMAVAGGAIAPVELVEVTAQKDFYVGGHWTANQLVIDGEREFFESSVTGYGLGAQAGYTFINSDDFTTAVEGRITYTFMGEATDNEFWTGDIMLKPGYDFAGASVYALAGYTYTDFDIDNFGDDTRDGFVWGAGVEFTVADDIKVFGDYTVRPEITDVIDNEVLTLGVNYAF